MRRRDVPLMAAGIALLVVVAVFVAPVARAGILVDLLKGHAWPLLVVAAAVMFWTDIKNLAAEFVSRAQGEASIQAGIFSVSERVPVPPATEPVSLESIALLHTSFLRPDRTSEINDGRT